MAITCFNLAFFSIFALQLSIVLVKLYLHFGTAEKLIKKEKQSKEKAQSLEQEERN